MAQSVITDIYDGIAAWAPTYDTTLTIDVRNYNNLNGIMHSTHAPLRMLLVTDPQNNQGAEYAFSALGTTITNRWYITDRLFLQEVQMDGGMEAHMEKIILYLRSYGEIVRNNRGISSSVKTAEVVGFRAYPGVFQWPNYEGGTAYHGVDIILEIMEYQTGA